MKRDTVLGKRATQYRKLAGQLRDLPLIAQGNVFAIAPQEEAPRATTHYKWTRKVKAKTVTIALSREQYEALKDAIEANRAVEKTLRRMRDISQDAILRRLPASPGKRARNRPKPPLS